MMNVLAELFGIAEQHIWDFAHVFLRVGAMMALLPAFGEQAVPTRIKLGAAIAFTLIASPVVGSEQTVHPESLSMVLGAEIVIGLLLGLLFRFFVLALQTAGSIAANVMSLSQLFGGGVGTDPQPAFASLMVIAGLALACMLGLHIYVIEALILSYDLFPLGTLPSGSDVATWGIEKVARCFTLALSLAGPFVVASILYNLGLGVINRAMPQLMVAFVGAPAISMGGLVLLLVASPFILAYWIKVFMLGVDLTGEAFR